MASTPKEVKEEDIKRALDLYNKFNNALMEKAGVRLTAESFEKMLELSRKIGSESRYFEMYDYISDRRLLYDAFSSLDHYSVFAEIDLDKLSKEDFNNFRQLANLFHDRVKLEGELLENPMWLRVKERAKRYEAEIKEKDKPEDLQKVMNIFEKLSTSLIRQDFSLTLEDLQDILAEKRRMELETKEEITDFHEIFEALGMRGLFGKIITLNPLDSIILHRLDNMLKDKNAEQVRNFWTKVEERAKSRPDIMLVRKDGIYVRQEPIELRALQRESTVSPHKKLLENRLEVNRAYYRDLKEFYRREKLEIKGKPDTEVPRHALEYFRRLSQMEKYLEERYKGMIQAEQRLNLAYSHLMTEDERAGLLKEVQNEKNRLIKAVPLLQKTRMVESDIGEVKFEINEENALKILKVYKAFHEKVHKKDGVKLTQEHVFDIIKGKKGVVLEPYEQDLAKALKQIPKEKLPELLEESGISPSSRGSGIRFTEESKEHMDTLQKRKAGEKQKPSTPPSRPSSQKP